MIFEYFREIELRLKKIEIARRPVDAFHGKMKIPKEMADEIIDMEMWD